MTGVHDASPEGSLQSNFEVCSSMAHGKQPRVRSVVWNGTLREQLDLIAAVQHYCACQYDGSARCIAPCAGHAMLAHDQRALDGLLWSRHLRTRRLREEGVSKP